MTERKNPEQAVNFAAPPPPPSIYTNPAAATYARQQQLRNQVDSAKVSDPRGGAPTPPMPRLDNPNFEPGMSISDHAQSARMAPLYPGMDPAQIESMQKSLSGPRQAPKGILPTDTLPSVAREDPLYQRGAGADLAVNQPMLARRYGVIRNGKLVPAANLETGRPGLSPDTVQALEEINRFNKMREEAESPDRAAEKATMDSSSGAAGQISGPFDFKDKEEDRKLNPEESARIKKAISEADHFDHQNFREHLLRDLINNDDQRKIVEERLSPLDLSELIINGRLEQRVPIIPGKLEPIFQSMTGEEDLALKRLAVIDKSLEVPDAYVLERYQLMALSIGIVKIGSKIFPSHLDSNGRIDDKLFLAKYDQISRLPFLLLSTLGVHYAWFDMRVRKLFVAERIKNG